MITSSSIPYISKALNEPQNISEADKESIDALINAYPYFMPARYMDAAQQQKTTPFHEDLMARMQLYSGNWILYSDFLNSVTDEEVEMSISTQEIDAVEENTEDDIPKVINTEPTIETTAEPQDILDTVTAESNIEEEEESTDNFIPVNTDFNTGDKPYVRKEKKEESSIEKTVQNIVEKQNDDDEALILPVYTDDYFLHQGVNVSNKLPDDYESAQGAIEEEENEDEKSLMVVMSFAEWLNFFKSKKKAEEEEEEGQRALKTMWQKEKLAAALEEEDDEIPENVFEMAVNSISKEDGLISESLANIHIKQGRYDKAIDMYRKLSLRNPQKKAYFARKIEHLIKEQEQ